MRVGDQHILTLDGAVVGGKVGTFAASEWQNNMSIIEKKRLSMRD